MTAGSTLARDSVLGHINSILSELHEAEKHASEMGLSGDSATDPGGYSGKSTHPSAKVDGHTGPAELGQRGKENERDLEDTFPAAVDNTSPGSGGSQDDRQIQMGTRQSAVGEDPKTEHDYKTDKDDPGTSHPANAEKIGDKYASALPIEEHIKLSYAKLNDLLEEIASGGSIDEEKSQQQQKSAQHQAARQGYNLAASAQTQAPLPDVGFDKLAVSQFATEDIIREAFEDADRVGALYQAHRKAAAQAVYNEQVRQHQQQYQQPQYPAYQMPVKPGTAMKQAAGPMMPPPDAGGGMPPDMAAMMPPGGDTTGGGAGGEVMPPDAQAAAGGGDPSGGGGDHQAALEELINAMLEMGMSPEEIVAAAQSAGVDGGGAEGGGAPPMMPPDAGGMPPKAASARQAASPRVQHMAMFMRKRADDAQALSRLSRDIIRHRDAGRLKIKAAHTPHERAEREELKSFIREVCGAK